MSYFPKGHHDAGDAFDNFDTTPYGGGYDISLTYGRPFPPSEETCYPNTSRSDVFDYDRPHYTSYAEPSAYANEALENEYKSYVRRKPQPGPPSYGGAPLPEGYGYDRPKPNYGFQPGRGSEYGGGAPGGFGSGRPEYGSGYERPRSEYGQIPGYQEPGSEYGSGYGRKPQYEEPSSEYGSGYGRKPQYEVPSSEYGSGYGMKPHYEEPSSEYGSGYGRKPESEVYGSGGYGRKTSYGEEVGGGGYGYGGRFESTEYGDKKPGYGRSEEVEYRKPSYERRDDEGYGRKKYIAIETAPADFRFPTTNQTRHYFTRIVVPLALGVPAIKYVDVLSSSI